jgi:hypothetical protein
MRYLGVLKIIAIKRLRKPTEKPYPNIIPTRYNTLCSVKFGKA